MFSLGLKSILGESFRIDALDSVGLGNHLDDLQIMIARKVLGDAFRVQATRDTLWIGEKFDNKAFLDAVAGLGFDQRIVDHLLSKRDRLNVGVFKIIQIGPMNAKTIGAVSSDEVLRAAQRLGQAA